MNQFTQWEFLQNLKPGDQVESRLYGKYTVWIKLDGEGYNDGYDDYFVQLTTGKIRHFSWLVDEFFPVRGVKF
jgi:hypothetical protein